MKKKTVLRITGGILGLILVIGIIVLGYVNSKLDKIQYDDGNREIDTTTEYPDDDALDISSLPTAPPDTQGSGADVSEFEALVTDDVFNILFLGTDERTPEFNENARADSIMVVSINRKEHTIKLASIERGIGVPVPGRNDDLITHTFRYGGAQLTLSTVQQCFDLDVDRYVRINFNMFIQAIDAIGGIDIDLTQLEADGLNGKVYTNATVKIPVCAGRNHLDGYSALQYCRLRYIDSDWQRIERQRKTIRAVVDKLKTLSLSEVDHLANTILPLIQTNLEKKEIAGLMLEVPAFLQSDIRMSDMTIPVKGTYWGHTGVDGRNMFGVDFKENARILREFFYAAQSEENETVS